MEMVEELEISHLEPLEIATMIDNEILALFPNWMGTTHGKGPYQRQHSFNYEEDEDVNIHNPFLLSSSCPSSPRDSLTKTQFCGKHATFTQELNQGTYKVYKVVFFPHIIGCLKYLYRI